MYLYRDETLFLVISWFLGVFFFIRLLINRKGLTYWQFNYRGTAYFLLLIYLFMSSLDWWRLNVSIDTLISSQGCFVRSFSRGGVLLINNGIKQGYAVGTNRKNDPIISIKGMKKGDCFMIKYYYQLDIPYLYSIQKLN